MYSEAENILISIHPQYSKLIFSGEKRIEFRKSRIPHSIKRVVVYETMPTGKIVGYFEVNRVEILSPKEMWKKYGSIGGIEEKKFKEYFMGKETAYGILVKRAYKFNKTFNLSTLKSVAPQCFKYLNEADIKKLL